MLGGEQERYLVKDALFVPSQVRNSTHKNYNRSTFLISTSYSEPENGFKKICGQSKKVAVTGAIYIESTKVEEAAYRNASVFIKRIYRPQCERASHRSRPDAIIAVMGSKTEDR